MALSEEQQQIIANTICSFFSNYTKEIYKPIFDFISSLRDHFRSEEKIMLIWGIYVGVYLKLKRRLLPINFIMKKPLGISY